MGGPEIKTVLFMQTTLIKTAAVKNSYFGLNYEIKTVLLELFLMKTFIRYLSPIKLLFLFSGYPMYGSRVQLRVLRTGKASLAVLRDLQAWLGSTW